MWILFFDFCDVKEEGFTPYGYVTWLYTWACYLDGLPGSALAIVPRSLRNRG